jgi:hypothetical protein
MFVSNADPFIHTWMGERAEKHSVKFNATTSSHISAQRYQKHVHPVALSYVPSKNIHDREVRE